MLRAILVSGTIRFNIPLFFRKFSFLERADDHKSHLVQPSSNKTLCPGECRHWVYSTGLQRVDRAHTRYSAAFDSYRAHSARAGSIVVAGAAPTS